MVLLALMHTTSAYQIGWHYWHEGLRRSVDLDAAAVSVKDELHKTLHRLLAGGDLLSRPAPMDVLESHCKAAS